MQQRLPVAGFTRSYLLELRKAVLMRLTGVLRMTCQDDFRLRALAFDVTGPKERPFSDEEMLANFRSLFELIREIS